MGSVHSIDVLIFFFFKQKTAYEMRISDWSSDVCSFRSARSAFIATRPFTTGHSQKDGKDEPDGGDELRSQRRRARRFRGAAPHRDDQQQIEIGRASCRERVCQYV